MSHWVFTVTAAHRQLIHDRMPSVAYGSSEYNDPTQRPHLLEMLDKIDAGGMSVAKANRWLGWIQACLCVRGAATLEEVKRINKMASDHFEGKL